ncbi:hypothetical protein TNCV_2830111 [Trichonephila clavipes]|nr:hypothetical protein TNCV_2830111 [Trichonephila clavipes]
MLVRLSRAPVLSGGLRRKTQLSRYPLHGRFLQDPTSPVKDPQFKTPLKMPVFPGSSPLCHHSKSEKPSDTASCHSGLVCHRTSWQKNKDSKVEHKKERIEHKRNNKIKIWKEIEEKSNEKNVI